MDREQRSLLLMGAVMFSVGAIFLLVAVVRGRDLGGPSGTLASAMLLIALGVLTPRRKGK